jgi:hypothetical protein
MPPARALPCRRLRLRPARPIVGGALARMTHLHGPPADTLNDRRVVGHVNAFLANRPDLERPPDCLPRQEFERLAGIRDR